jgi:predicted DNA-binding protein
MIIEMVIYEILIKMDKTSIYSVRLSETQRAKLDRKAKDLGVKPSQLVREHIFKLLEYGTYGLKDKE